RILRYSFRAARLPRAAAKSAVALSAATIAELAIEAHVEAPPTAAPTSIATIENINDLPAMRAPLKADDRRRSRCTSSYEGLRTSAMKSDADVRQAVSWRISEESLIIALVRSFLRDAKLSDVVRTLVSCVGVSVIIGTLRLHRSAKVISCPSCPRNHC